MINDIKVTHIDKDYNENKTEITVFFIRNGERHVRYITIKRLLDDIEILKFCSVVHLKKILTKYYEN